MRLLPASDRQPEPWKNGGGVTSEVVAERDAMPGGESRMRWRVSIATIAHAGDFSFYPGYTRHLMPIGGRPLRMLVDDAPVMLAPGEVLRFDGAQRVAATDIDAPQSDLNVIADGALIDATLVHESLGEPRIISARSGETVIVVALSGELRVGDARLETGDAAVLSDEGQLLTFLGEAAVARIRTREDGPREDHEVRLSSS